jgi:hypothetical protein
MPTLADILAKKKAGADSGGIRITPESAKAAKAAEVKAFLDASAPKAPPPAPRELGAATRGERIPMDHPPQDATEADKQWFSACHSFDSEMCIVIEPGETSEHAWLACRPNPHRPPILLHRLPLVGRPTEANPY